VQERTSGRQLRCGDWGGQWRHARRGLAEGAPWEKFIKKMLWKFIVSARPCICETAGIIVLGCNAVHGWGHVSAVYPAAGLKAVQCCTVVILRLGMDDFMSVDPETPTLINRLNSRSYIIHHQVWLSQILHCVYRLHWSILYRSLSKQRLLSCRELTNFFNNRAGACLLHGTSCIFIWN
jgi:hypothetical protein